MEAHTSMCNILNYQSCHSWVYTDWEKCKLLSLNLIIRSETEENYFEVTEISYRMCIDISLYAKILRGLWTVGELVALLCNLVIMGSHVNFKNFGDAAQTGGSCWNSASNNSLARQSSIFSLTFDEFQNTLGGSGKEFGSMNMEDLLKSIWTAEESQAMVSSMGGGDGSAPNGNLHRQGSLTLPRTVSQKTVDEVWSDVLKETIGVRDVSTNGGSNLGPREPTLGEMTLEEFLVRAGVVREDIQPFGGPTSNGIYGGFPLQNDNNVGLTIEFQQPSQNQVVLSNQLAHHNNMVLTSSNLGINPSGASMSSVISQPQTQQPQPLFPKQTTLAFSSAVQLGNNAQLASPRKKGPVVGITNFLNNTIGQGGAMAMGGLQSGVTIARGSQGNHLHSDVIVKSNIDAPSLSPSPSPVPYAFGEVGRGRRSSSSLEKVVERRRKRMIKNRESAARSRARKQAYTIELEAEVATLKEMNHDLQKKQEEILEKQKDQMLETVNMPRGVKRRCLRRTGTGPW